MDWGQVFRGFVPTAMSLDDKAEEKRRWQLGEDRAAKQFGWAEADRDKDLKLEQSVKDLMSEKAALIGELSSRKAGAATNSFMRAYNSQQPGLDDLRFVNFRGFDANGNGVVDHYENFESAQKGAGATTVYSPTDMEKMVNSMYDARLAAVDPTGKFSGAYYGQRKLGQGDRGLDLQARTVRVGERGADRSDKEFGYTWENWNGQAGGKNWMEHLQRDRQVGAMESNARSAARQAATMEEYRKMQGDRLNFEMFKDRVALQMGPKAVTPEALGSTGLVAIGPNIFQPVQDTKTGKTTLQAVTLPGQSASDRALSAAGDPYAVDKPASGGLSVSQRYANRAKSSAKAAAMLENPNANVVQKGGALFRRTVDAFGNVIDVPFAIAAGWGELLSPTYNDFGKGYRGD